MHNIATNSISVSVLSNNNIIIQLILSVSNVAVNGYLNKLQTLYAQLDHLQFYKTANSFKSI